MSFYIILNLLPFKEVIWQMPENPHSRYEAKSPQRGVKRSEKSTTWIRYVHERTFEYKNTINTKSKLPTNTTS